MIKIGIPPAFMYPDKNRKVFGPKSLSYIENDMTRYIAQKGILPVLIPDVENEYLTDILSEMDGFVFQGGSDIAPETFRENPIGKWKGDAIRDRFELKIMDFAITNSKPVLGICRGFQLMNVYFGGTLFQDIVTQNPSEILHRSAELYDTIKHQINIVKGTILDKIYKDEKLSLVNSVHHMAVNKLGKDLDIYAHATDGIIEAFGYSKEPVGKVMGVQWHPEFSHTIKDELIDADKLFDVFISYVKAGIKKL